MVQSASPDYIAAVVIGLATTPLAACDLTHRMIATDGGPEVRVLVTLSGQPWPLTPSDARLVARVLLDEAEFSWSRTMARSLEACAAQADMALARARTWRVIRGTWPVAGVEYLDARRLARFGNAANA